MAGFPVPLAFISMVSKESHGFEEATIFRDRFPVWDKNFNIAGYHGYPFEGSICMKKAGVKTFQTQKSR
jgi:hypothetical protein